MLTAISHPTRWAIIQRLAGGPARFSSIAKPSDPALSAVSKHLKLLERAGLIERRKQGREVFVSLRAEPLREVASWVNGSGPHFKEKKGEEAMKKPASPLEFKFERTIPESFP